MSAGCSAQSPTCAAGNKKNNGRTKFGTVYTVHTREGVNNLPRPEQKISKKISHCATILNTLYPRYPATQSLAKGRNTAYPVHGLCPAQQRRHKTKNARFQSNPPHPNSLPSPLTHQIAARANDPDVPVVVVAGRAGTAVGVIPGRVGIANLGAPWVSCTSRKTQ